MASALTNQFQVDQVSLSPVSNSKMFTCCLKHGSKINLGSEFSGCSVVALPTQMSILYSCKGLQSQILHYYVYKYLCYSLQKLSSLLNDTRRNNTCYLVSTPRFLPYCLLGYFLLCKVTYQQQTYSTYERFSRTIKITTHKQLLLKRCHKICRRPLRRQTGMRLESPQSLLCSWTQPQQPQNFLDM